MKINDELIEEAMRVGGHQSKEAAVTEALKEYIQRRQQARIIELFGKIDFDEDYDYKQARGRS